LTALIIAVSGAIAAPEVSAKPVGPGARRSVFNGGGQDNSGRISVRGGNGKANRNFWQVLSPSFNSGPQQVQNVNLSGKTNTQVAFCKRRHRVCKISQRLRSR
jgi:hypothetical protein